MDECVVSDVWPTTDSLFKLFLLASIFALSTWDLAGEAILFWTAEAAKAGSEDATAMAATTFSSWQLGPEPLEAAEAPKGAGGNGTLLRGTSFFGSTFSAVVDSDIAPGLGLSLGLRAWIPVYNLHKNSWQG